MQPFSFLSIFISDPKKGEIGKYMTEEKKIKPMWSAIHHDRQKNLMFVWYTDGTRTAVKTKHRFFVQ